MKIRAVQIDIITDVDSNIDHAFHMAATSSLTDIDVLLFPELFTTGYQLPIIHEIAHKKDDPIFNRAITFAKKHNVNIILGSIAFKEDDNVFNRSLVITREGEIISEYSKLHLFRLMDEHQYLTEGIAPHVFELDNTMMSSIICYDLRFPELTRKIYLEQQPKVIFVPMEWPAPRTEAFRALLKARAIENQCYVVSCNRIGEENNSVFEGHSLACDPYGNILNELGDQEGIMDVDIDLSVIDKVRNHMTCLSDRRPDIY